MNNSIDFQPYLESLLKDEKYQAVQECYTALTVEDRRSQLQSRMQLKVGRLREYL